MRFIRFFLCFVFLSFSNSFFYFPSLRLIPFSSCLVPSLSLPPPTFHPLLLLQLPYVLFLPTIYLLLLLSILASYSHSSIPCSFPPSTSSTFYYYPSSPPTRIFFPISLFVILSIFSKNILDPPCGGSARGVQPGGTRSYPFLTFDLHGFMATGEPIIPPEVATAEVRPWVFFLPCFSLRGSSSSSLVPCYSSVSFP